MQEARAEVDVWAERTATMEIRTATQEDCPGLLPIQRQSQALHHRSLPSFYRNPDDEALRGAMSDLIAADDTVVWVAVVNAVPIGFLVFKLITIAETACNYARREGLIDHIAVDERFHRRGAGRALIGQAELHARSIGCAELRLAVLVNNERARQFYAALGLTPFFERWRKEL
jgi:ribosomal protein S18 acetylase RimI-like enzyme